MIFNTIKVDQLTTIEYNTGHSPGVLKMQNEALIFIKPHATNPTAVNLIETFLQDKAIELLDKGTLSSEEIDKKGIVDRHYFAIANAAAMNKPSQLKLSAQAIANFEDGFGVSWSESCQQGIVLNGVDLQAKMGNISGVDLNKMLSSVKQVKMAPGLYAAFLKKEGIYGINGFYPALREVFTAAGNQVIWYHARFNPKEVSWATFRQNIIGATDPQKAVAGSLRSELYHRYDQFDLSNQPSMSENGVHASAGPLEGLRERQVWLGAQVEDDDLGKLLIEKGVDLEKFLDNPIVTLKGSTGPVFDLTEDIDSEQVADLLI